MTSFARELRRAQPRSGRARRWLLVSYDQLHDRIGPLSREPATELGIVLVENRWKASRRPYHKQKLALVLANQRHFALEQARRGVAVRHVVGDAPHADLLRPIVAELGPLRVQRPAERELRADLAPLLAGGGLEELPHEGWLTEAADFEDQAGPPWRMDAFYRRVRRRTGVLMADGRPVGGRFSFDADNRQPWRGEPAAPDELRFPRDDIKDEVLELVATRFAEHPGQLRPDHLPATLADAQALWRHARRHCLPGFGPFEDAMASASPGLFHTRIAPLLNLHRLLPRDVLRDVLDLDLPLASKEGFVRQVLGWREFVRHVHEATDGFRRLPGQAVAEVDGGAAPAFLGAGADLPPAFWGRPSGLHCLDRVVADVWREGWSHHITRLMVLGNIAALLDVSPRQLTDWFWVAYTDAYDWVVEPNVLGMATFAAGDVMTTKPYVAGSAYLKRMSDYCGDCAFDPRRNCPLTRLYWAFLGRHADRLAGNPRMALPLRSATRRSAAERRRDAATFTAVSERLGRGAALGPDDLTTAARR